MPCHLLSSSHSFLPCWQTWLPQAGTAPLASPSNVRAPGRSRGPRRGCPSCAEFRCAGVVAVVSGDGALWHISPALPSAACPAPFHAHIVRCLLAASLCAAFTALLYLTSKDGLSVRFADPKSLWKWESILLLNYWIQDLFSYFCLHMQGCKMFHFEWLNCTEFWSRLSWSNTPPFNKICLIQFILYLLPVPIFNIMSPTFVEITVSGQYNLHTLSGHKNFVPDLYKFWKKIRRNIANIK